MESKKSFHYAWIILLALCVIRSLAAAGINNTGGLFLKPVSTALMIGVGSLSIYFSVSSIATLLFMPFGGMLINRLGARTIILAAVVMQVGGFIALGFMNSVWAWYLLSIPMGIGGAVLVNLLGPILVNRWFRKQAGMALGILMASVGVFGAVIQPIMTRLIADRGWRFSYVVPGIIVLVFITLFALLFIRDTPQQKGILPYGVDDGREGYEKGGQQSGLSYQEARKSKSFYMLIIFMISITAFGAFNQHMATYGAGLGYTPGQVGGILSVGMIGSTIGAILIGIISDRVGALKSALGIVAIVLVSILCLSLGRLSLLIFGAGSFFMGLGSMGIPVLAPLLTKEFFGEKDYEVIYSNVMTGPPLATVFLLPLYGFIYDIFDSYYMVFIILLVVIIVGAVSLWMGGVKDK